MSWAAEVLAKARNKYELATEALHTQRDLGNIVRLDRSVPEEDDEYAKGVRWRCLNGTAATVMGVWQKCKAELDAAAANAEREAGRTAHQRTEAPAIQDSRLPRERDDEEEARP